MSNKILALLAIAVVVGRWLAVAKRQALSTHPDKARHKREELSDWEGEGGALPETGAQTLGSKGA